MIAVARPCLIIAALMVPALGQTQTNRLTPEQEKREALRMPDLDRSALEPSERKPTDVRQNERNPFGLLSVPPPEQEEELKIEVETEEMKIRRILGNMRVAGLAGAPGDYRVMIGSMKLAVGDTVPRLFANQGEVLRVDQISDRQIVLSFVERKQQQDLPPRTIGLGIDLTPRVRSLLPGEVFTNVVKFDEKGGQAMDPLKTDSVESIVRQVKSGGGTEALTDHRRAFLGETYPAPKNEPSEDKAAE